MRDWWVWRSKLQFRFQGAVSSFLIEKKHEGKKKKREGERELCHPSLGLNLFDPTQFLSGKR